MEHLCTVKSDNSMWPYLKSNNKIFFKQGVRPVCVDRLTMTGWWIGVLMGRIIADVFQYALEMIV